MKPAGLNRRFAFGQTVTSVIIALSRNSFFHD